MNWRGDEYIAEAQRTYGQRVQASAFYLLTRVRENISIPSRTVSMRIGRGVKVMRDLGPRGSSRSRPGEFPHKDFGVLRQGIAQDFDPDTTTARVGTNVAYGKFLEFGTSRMRPRPFLRRTLAEEREAIRQMIEFGARSDITVE